MNLEKVTEQLKREAAAHPVKAGALGLGLVLAVWFWIPLIGKLVGGEESPRPAARKPNGAAVAKSMTETAPNKNAVNAIAATRSLAFGSGASDSWQRLTEWMETDPRMASATNLVNQYDPFQPFVPPQPVLAEEDGESEASPKAIQRFVVTPESIGLELTGTLVGNKLSVAMINGKSYRLTRTASGPVCEPPYIKIQRNDQELRLQLTSVQAKSVIVEMDGHRMRLKMTKVKTDDAVTFTAVTPRG